MPQATANWILRVKLAAGNHSARLIDGLRGAGKIRRRPRVVHARDLCVIREELAWVSALADVFRRSAWTSPIALAGAKRNNGITPAAGKGRKARRFRADRT